jgi:hypothetical protein
MYMTAPLRLSLPIFGICTNRDVPSAASADLFFRHCRTSGWADPWHHLMVRGFGCLEISHRTHDCLHGTFLTGLGACLDILGHSAVALRRRLIQATKRPGAAFDVCIPARHSLAANGRRHLLDACFSRMSVGSDQGWRDLPSEFAGLELSAFIAPATGALDRNF